MGHPKAKLMCLYNIVEGNFRFLLSFSSSVGFFFP